MFAIIALAAQAVGQIYGAVSSARAAGQNRRFANRAAADVLERAEFDVEQYERGLAQVQGQQVTGLAAQGLDITQGTAQQIQEQTAAIGARDMEQIRLNAEREAWGIRTQANINYRAGMNQAWAQGIQGAGVLGSVGNTLLTRGVDSWQNWMGRRTLNSAANQGVFVDTAWR